MDVEYLDSDKIKKATFKTVDETDRNKLADIIKKHDIQTMHTKEATLEEIFIQVTGRGLV